ncbi:MAG TPA: YigZ family protein [Spirochaetia bacterium]|nr:YigZ family protein [Spirochaetia bacterium]
MRVPQGTFEAEICVKKSRFFARAESIEQPEDARTVVKRRREEHPGATHVVHAFITGMQGEVNGCSDDHEPAGTAGRPILEILKGSGITNIIVTVVRYFGGTKLGTGGLVHAYSEAAKAALAGLSTKEFSRWVKFELTSPYELFERIRAVLVQRGAEILSENFTTTVHIAGRVPEEAVPVVEEQIRTVSNGKIVVYFE